MSLREWLIAIGALVILGIVIDGVRRMRRTRREAAEISSGMGADNIADPDDTGEYNPELPNGGSRPIDRAELESRGYFKSDRSRSRFANPPQKPTRPVVGDSRSDEAHDRESYAADSAEYLEETSEVSSGFTATDSRDDAAGVDESLTAYDDDLSAYREGDDHNLNAQPETDTSEGGTHPPDESPDPREQVSAGEASSPAEDQDDWHGHSARNDIDADPERPLAGANRPDAQEVVVINVLADQERLFDGGSLRRLFEGCGLEFGDMAIYHRHEENDTRSPVQFSVANALEPGTFRAQDLDGMKTPGISFFMSMPGPSDSMQAFEFMLETAQCVVKNLDGELKDERRSVMTRQTIEHCRQRIREYERKRRSMRVG